MIAKGVIHSMRLRTLPLSLAGTLLGILLALRSTSADGWLIAALALTTAALQILSNMSNELGDFIHGVDDSERGGPQYSLQQGDLSVDDLRKCVRWAEIFCYAIGIAMIALSFGTLLKIEAAALLLLGIFAVWAAKHYTLGKHPYGYMAMGDLFVLLFFGLVPVMGSYFVISHNLEDLQIILPSLSVGLFSVAVLNVNNIRDMKTDRGKRLTVPLLIGKNAAKLYQTSLILAGWGCAAAFALPQGGYGRLLCFAVLPLFAMHLLGVWRREGRDLDPMLPLLVISTFCFSLLLGIGSLL